MSVHGSTLMPSPVGALSEFETISWKKTPQTLLMAANVFAESSSDLIDSSTNLDTEGPTDLFSIESYNKTNNGMDGNTPLIGYRIAPFFIDAEPRDLL
ncbi:hypothetical protein E4U12_007728 [Claviceps purpurea]|nr:hypothetical protein E4U12_007728 [Claviceps purpurea]